MSLSDSFWFYAFFFYYLYWGGFQRDSVISRLTGNDDAVLKFRRFDKSAFQARIEKGSMKLPSLAQLEARSLIFLVRMVCLW
jgi:hypothetical protein